MNNYHIKVYVAGKYNDNNVIEVLKNIGKGEKLATELFKLGFSPFVPWFDKAFILNDPYYEWDTNTQYFKDYSIDWLRVCDCMLLVPGWERSGGAKKEIEIAEKEINIPVFETIEELIIWSKQKNKPDVAASGL